MPQPIILHLDALTKQFPHTASPAVSNLTLKLHQGELLGLLGPSGCGKTTLLRLIAGFEQPDAGSIELAERIVAGVNQWLPPEQRDIGMVFQDYALFPHLTVAENVAFGLKHQQRKAAERYTSKQIKHLTTDAIALVGLTGLDRRYPHQLSGGQQQRVALARALAPRPALVLLDEPLSNLDVQVRLRLRQEVRDILKATGTSGIFVTHDQEEALSISDRVAVMQSGHLEQFGTPEAIYQEPTSRFVAEFVTQANFLPATRNGQVWETEIGCFTVSSPSESASSPVSDLMIRQEDLILNPHAAGIAVIRDRQFLGREHRYCVSCPSGHTLHARVTAGTPLDIGTRVNLCVADSTVRVFSTHADPCRVSFAAHPPKSANPRVNRLL